MGKRAVFGAVAMSKKPTTRKKTGARKPPVSFSQTLFDAMVVEVMEGSTLREICSGNSRPSRTQFLQWVHERPGLSDQYRRAREISSYILADEIRELEQGITPDNATASKTRFEIKRWDIARRAPKVFGDKQQLEHSGPDGGPITEIRHTIVDPKNDRNSAP
ncbi:MULTISPECIES: lysozyme [unclassified Saccharibacter]|uniref:terminase small subunit-like protein n=1 Tax=unclassified Saccharibacter TaxID=2648722 RepID=UPI001321621E|nr:MULTISPECIES: lysozyme [unclassified Saccharibacter]MXV35777.1 hypothetical protein [Saccharibacter sp. EH611]MXV58929.1 hypothetical protein [Saccharibacter sp. EH70]MXV65908.1 hypothetical protein [Saccharibacter sp. EH60]